MSKVKLLYPVASGVLSDKPVPMIDLPPVVLASDYAALEAENARLAAEFAEFKADRRAALAKISEASQLAEQRISELQAERDAALAQLAAIQQAKGEEVEVVAVKVYDREDGYKLSDDDSEIAAWGASKGTNVWLRDPLVSLAQHQRITAAMAAEVERLTNEASALAAVACDGVVGDDYGHAYCRYKAERDKLLAGLASTEARLSDCHDLVREANEARKHAEDERDELRAELERLREDYDKAWRRAGIAEENTQALIAELAAVKGQGAVAIGHVALGSHTGVVFYSHLPQLPDGAKLYALPPASPDVEGLVKALELIADTDPDDGTAWFHEVADTALSTWRQGQGKP